MRIQEHIAWTHPKRKPTRIMTCDWFSPGWKEENWFRSYPTPLIGSLTGDQHNCRQTSRVEFFATDYHHHYPESPESAAARPTHWKMLWRKACLVWDGNPVCLFNAHGLGGPKLCTVGFCCCLARAAKAKRIKTFLPFFSRSHTPIVHEC